MLYQHPNHLKHEQPFSDLNSKTMALTYTQRHIEQVCVSEGQKPAVLIWRVDNMMLSEKAR